MRPRCLLNPKKQRAVFAVAALVGVLGACSSGSVSVDGYNSARHSFSAGANKTAASIAAKIVARGVTCVDYKPSAFEPLVTGYVKAHLPLPVGSGECTGGPAKENVLIEVFRPTAPNGSDFMRRKGELICKKALKFGRKQDGTNDFPGLPYLIAPDKSWVVEPDSVRFARTLGRALGRPVKDACAGYKR